MQEKQRKRMIYLTSLSESMTEHVKRGVEKSKKISTAIKESHVGP